MRGFCKRHYGLAYGRGELRKIQGRGTGDPVQWRHRAAMSIVRKLGDEEDRWTLLDYVLNGSESVDQALAA